MGTGLRQIKTATSLVSSDPTPMVGELQAAFYLRAMRVLRKRVPSINRRTLEILRLWRESDSDRDLRDKAAAQFPAELFQCFSPRCLFVEHTVPASLDGQFPELHYGRDELQKMVDWANYRIRNADTFSVLADGHTPTQAELVQGRPMPEVLGYVGPFYLGQLGDVNPRWAIYAEEWVHRADLPQYEKRQRRSPEVWVGEPIERRTMDPIAALGAETPRLDCGMNSYSRAGDGQTVMPYSAMTIDPAVQRVAEHSDSFPFPVSDGVSGTHHTAGELAMPLPVSDPTLGLPATSGIDPRILEATVLKTVSALLPSIVHTVQSQLNNDQDQSDDEFDDLDESDDDNFDSDVPLDGDEPDDENLDDPDDLADEARLRYSAMSEDCRRAYQAGFKRGASRVHRYSHSSDLHSVVARQQARLQELSDQITRERREAMRYSRLTELSHEFAFDPRDEVETCRDMSDKQFDRHCTVTITKYARRDDVTNVELFSDPSVSVDRYGSGSMTRANVEQIERYSREAAAIAARKNAAKRGSTTFASEFDAICREHGLST